MLISQKSTTKQGNCKTYSWYTCLLESRNKKLSPSYLSFTRLRNFESLCASFGPATNCPSLRAARAFIPGVAGRAATIANPCRAITLMARARVLTARANVVKYNIHGEKRVAFHAELSRRDAMMRTWERRTHIEREIVIGGVGAWPIRV